MSQLLFRLVIILLTLLIFRIQAVRRCMEWVIPIAFTYYVVWKQVFLYFPHGLPTFSGNILQIVCAGICLSCWDGRVLGRNGVLKAFVFFWAYVIFSMFLGERRWTTALYCLDVAVEYILPSVAVASWVLMRPNEWKRLICYLTVTIFLISLLFIRTSGSVSASSGMGERTGIDSESLGGEELNVNLFGLMIVSILPWCLIGVLEQMKTRWAMVLRALQGTSILILTALLVRTGSRNSALVLLPMGAYLLFAKSSLKKIHKIGIVVLVFMFVLLGLFVLSGEGKLEDMRIFNYKGGYKSDVTTGRADFFAEYISWLHRTPVNVILGGGALLPRKDTLWMYFTFGNGHSIYPQIYAQSGVVGIVLLVVFMIASGCGGLRLQKRGHLALMMIAIWFVTGVGESANITQIGSGGKTLLGFGIGFCCRGRYYLDDLWSRRRT